MNGKRVSNTEYCSGVSSAPKCLVGMRPPPFEKAIGKPTQGEHL